MQGVEIELTLQGLLFCERAGVSCEQGWRELRAGMT